MLFFGERSPAKYGGGNPACHKLYNQQKKFQNQKRGYRKPNN